MLMVKNLTNTEFINPLRPRVTNSSRIAKISILK